MDEPITWKQHIKPMLAIGVVPDMTDVGYPLDDYQFVASNYQLLHDRMADDDILAFFQFGRQGMEKIGADPRCRVDDYVAVGPDPAFSKRVERPRDGVGFSCRPIVSDEHLGARGFRAFRRIVPAMVGDDVDADLLRGIVTCPNGSNAASDDLLHVVRGDDDCNGG